MGVRFPGGTLLCSLCLMMMMMMMVSLSSATVALQSSNATFSCQDIRANFGPPVRSTGMCGKLYIAEPLDACSPLTNKVEHNDTRNCTSPIALIIRGGCSFEDKVKKAQKAGFEAVIVYDYVDNSALVARNFSLLTSYQPTNTVAGNSAGVKIDAVFVSKSSGEELKANAGLDADVWIIPSYGSSAWSIMAISFIYLLALSAVLATCFFVHRHRVGRQRTQGRVREFHGMSTRLVKAMPSLTFTVVTEDNCTSSACAICLEDYSVGDNLRILPCRHKFHAVCVDAWLTTWRTFCPVCKRDARTSNGEPPASESTPLLSYASSSSSLRSSSLHSSVIQIASPGSQSISSSPNIPRLLGSFRHNHPNSMSMSASRSSLDIRNTSLRNQFMSPHSLGYHSPSPLNNSNRYLSPYYVSPSNASLSYQGSFRRQPSILHHSESGHSLPRVDSRVVYETAI